VLPSLEGLSVVKVDAGVTGSQPTSREISRAGDLRRALVDVLGPCSHTVCRLHLWAVTWKHCNYEWNCANANGRVLTWL
jgi:hypothetical protein